jgi:hypothetical protein
MVDAMHQAVYGMVECFCLIRRDGAILSHRPGIPSPQEEPVDENNFTTRCDGYIIGIQVKQTRGRFITVLCGKYQLIFILRLLLIG